MYRRAAFHCHLDQHRDWTENPLALSCATGPESEFRRHLADGPESLALKRIRTWLRRTAYFDAAANLTFGSLIILAAVAVLAITFLAIVGAVWAVIQRVSATITLAAGRQVRVEFDLCLWVSGGLLMFLFLVNQRRSKHLSPFSRIDLSDPVSPKLLFAMATLVTDLLCAGPQLVTFASQALKRTVRLAGLKSVQASLLLSLLHSRSGRVTYSELSSVAGSENLVGLLAALKHVEGIVFLISEPQGVSLTEELRSELSRVVGKPESKEPNTIFVACSHCGFMITISNPHPGFYVRCANCASRNRLDLESGGGWRFSNRFEEQAESSNGLNETATNHYATLGLMPSASVDDIKRAYRRLMKSNHPDLVAGLGSDLQGIAEARTKEINLAYEALIRAKADK